MLSAKELKNFRTNRKLSVRDVAEYAELSISTISDVENGKKGITVNNYKAIVNGINKAFFAKVNDTKKPPVNKTKGVKTDGEG